MCRAQLYVGRLVSGFGVGAASMLTPLYVSASAHQPFPALKITRDRSARMLPVLSVVD
jgi:hypothetical protein